MTAGSIPADYATLKRIHRERRDGFPETLSLRTHRALSWLQRAEQETDDPDARFVFLWIALNAAYANEIRDREKFTERRVLVWFLDKLVKSDRERHLYEAVWENFPESIRLLIDNRYVFQPFWDYQSGRVDEATWLAKFEHSKKVARKALGRMDTTKVMSVMIDRLYTLRNQIVHGGATWNSSANRNQVRDGTKILEFVVPTVIYLMMTTPDQLWGEACYPVVDDA